MNASDGLSEVGLSEIGTAGNSHVEMGGGGYRVDGWCREAGKGSLNSDRVMWSSKAGQGVLLDCWETVSAKGQQGDIFSLVQFPEVCRICREHDSSPKQPETCESPLFQELVKGPNPESALAIACVNRSPKERRFGLELLAVLAEREEWTLKGFKENQYLGCLQTYLTQHFLRLVEEGKVVQRVDQSGRATWACFCTGLLSRHSEELLYCVIKRLENDSPSWVLHAFPTLSELQDSARPWNEGGEIVKAPSKASFCAVAGLVFDLNGFDGNIAVNSEVWGSLEAVRPCLPHSLRDASSHLLQQALASAAERSVNRARVDPFLVVPQFCRRGDVFRIQALLPLRLEEEFAVALVLDVEQTDAGAQAFIPRRLISLSTAYSNARVLTPQHQPWILNACLGSHPPGRNAWFRASPGQFPGHSIPPHFARDFTNRPEESLSGSPPKALAALNIDPPKSPNPQNPEGGHSHPGSRGSSDGWVTGSLGQVSSSGAFLTNMYGSGSSDSMQSLSPGKNSPPLEEQRAFHQDEQQAFSHQEARAEQMYREMAPRFDENGDGVNTPKDQQPHPQATAPFSNGLSASLASLKVSDDNFVRPEVFGFPRSFGQEDLRVSEGLRMSEGLRIPEGLRASEGLRMSEGLRIPEGLRASDGLGGVDMWPSKQEEAVRFSMAYDQERLSDLERDGVHSSEFYRLSGGSKPPGRPSGLDPWSRQYPGYSPEAVEARVDKDDVFVEFSPQDDLCPKVNISQLPPKFVATFLSGDANRPGFEHNAEQYAEQLFSRYGGVSKTLVRENKNHPGKWFAIVEFSYWTNEEVRQRLVAGEQIRFANFFDGEDVYVRRHKDKQSKMLRNGSGPASGLPCRPEWKYTGTDTRLGKPLYRGPCSLCGRESTVPFKPVVNGQPPRCRNCLPQEGQLGGYPGPPPSHLGGYSAQQMVPPERESGLMSLRKETLRTLSTPRLGSGVFLTEGGRTPQYGVERSHSLEQGRMLGETVRDGVRSQGFGGGGDINRTQSFGGGEANRGHGFGVNGREYGGVNEVSRLQAMGMGTHPGEYRRTSSLGGVDWGFSHSADRDAFTPGHGSASVEAMGKALRYDNSWSGEERRTGAGGFQGMGGAFPSSLTAASGAGAKFGGAYQHSYLD